MKKCFKSIVLGLTTLVGGNTSSAQDITFLKSDGEIKTPFVYTLMPSGIATMKYKTSDNYMPVVTDTTNQQLRYSHNFQSGIPAMDNYLDIKIIDGAGKKMKKDAIRSILADTPEALRKYNTGTRLYTTAAVLGIASIGILIVRLSNPEHKYVWLAAGISCSTGVVICRLVGTAKLKSAINIYNEANPNLHTSNLSLNFGLTHSGGLGFMLNF